MQDETQIIVLRKGEEEKRMNALKNKNPDGVLLTYQQVAEETNLGIATVTRLARESGALVKIGKTARVDPEILYPYIKKEYKAD